MGGQEREDDRRSGAWIPASIYASAWTGLLAAQVLLQEPHGARVALERRTGWDAGLYLQIAARGYDETLAAWFPGFALLVRWFTPVLGSGIRAGVAVSTVSGLAAAVLFWRWMAVRGQRGRAQLFGSLVLSTYPFGYFLLGVPYADGTYLALSLAAFLLAEQGRPGGATVAASAAAAVRPHGVLLVGALVLVLLERGGVLLTPSRQRFRWAGRLPLPRGIDRRRFRPSQLLVFAGLIAPALYFAYLGSRFGDPLLYVRRQAELTAADPVLDPRTLTRYVWFLRVGPTFGLGIGAAVSAVQGLLALACLVSVPAIIRRHGIGYGCYVLGIFTLIWLGSWDFSSAGRYVLAAFPVFALAGEGLARRPRLGGAVVTVSFLLLLWVALGYAVGEVYSVP